MLLHQNDRALVNDFFCILAIYLPVNHGFFIVRRNEHRLNGKKLLISFPLDSLRFKVYGQQCRGCDDDTFKNAKWYPEEVTKVLKNVHQKIGEVSLTLFISFTKLSLGFVCNVIKVGVFYNDES